MFSVFPVTTRLKPQVSPHNLRRTLCSPPQLDRRPDTSFTFERKVEFQASTRDDA